MKYYLTLVLITLLVGLNAQDKYSSLDSLYNLAKDIEDDSSRLQLYFNNASKTADVEKILYWYDRIKAENTGDDSVYWNGQLYHLIATSHFYSGEYEEDIQARRLAIEKYRRVGNENKVSRQFLNIGNAFSDMGENDSGLYYYNIAKDRAEEIEDFEILASVWINISTIHNYHGEKQKEIESLMKAIKISREHEVKAPLRNGLFNLAVHYAYAMEFEKSEELASELSELYKEDNDQKGLALLCNVRAKLMFDQGKPEEALLYLDTAMNIYKEMGFELKMAAISMNIGQVNAELKNYDRSKSYLNRALEVFKRIGDREYEANVYHDLALVYYATEEIELAKAYLKKAIEIVDSIGQLENRLFYVNQLATVYHDLGINDSAYLSMLEYSELVDSVHKKNNLDAIQRMEAEFQNERKELEIENLEQDKALQDAEIEKQQNEKKILFGGLAAALVLIIAVSYAFIQKKKDNQLISSQKTQLEEKHQELNMQKEIVEEKNREITDSINYASKIQEAVLPSNTLIKKHLPKSFTLYLPKDIVAGDFYWFDKLNDTLLIAVADCTGHGVPGAMVSVVCSNALNRAVREYKLSKPSDILNKCQELVAESLGNTDADVKDGMDIALCAIDRSENKIQYAGAYNPLWVIGNKPKSKSELISYQNQGSDLILYELKADKQAIGNSDNFQEFHNHELIVDSDSLIYLFSDGYLDQFGGVQGKKLKSRNLKNRLLALNSNKIEDQGDQLEKEFNDWKGNLEQLDDVCIIGFQI